LPYFAVAAEEENLQRAAARLGISQPALSRRIRDLEGELGILLFERVSGRLRLTPAGRFLGEEARRIIGEVDVLERALQARSGEGQARLSVSMNERAIALASVAGALRRFRLDNPAVDVTVKIMPSERQLDLLKDGQADIALMYCDQAAPPLRAVRIKSEDPFMLVVPAEHRLAGSSMISLKQTAGEDLIWPSRDRVPSNYEFLAQRWANAGLTPRVTTQIGNSDAAIHAVRAGLGLAVLRASALRGGSPDLVILPIEELRSDSLGLSAVWIDQHSNAVIRRLLRLLAEFGVIEAQDFSRPDRT